MKSFKSYAVAVGGAAVLAMTASVALAANDAPLDGSWASEFGPDDKAGAVLRTTPEMVLKAVGLVKQGKVATLGKVYQPDAPFFGTRGITMTIPGLPTGGPFGPQELVYNDEMLTAEIGQVGTQFDGPGHIGVRTSKGDYFYNGRMLQETANSFGMGDLGVEHVGKVGYVCRGVLLDATLLGRGDPLPIPVAADINDPGIISPDDIDKIIEMQGIAPIGPGDCVFLYTGHGNIWHPTEWDTYSAEEKQERIKAFNAGEPGLGISACEYLAERKIILTGGDTWAVDAIGPNFGGETEQAVECHIHLQTRRGIWNLENMDLHQLVADKAYEFLFAWSPLKIKGATGSPGNPIAIY